MTQSEYASKTRCLQDLHQFSVERLDKTKEKIKPTNKNKIKKSQMTLKKKTIFICHGRQYKRFKN